VDRGLARVYVQQRNTSDDLKCDYADPLTAIQNPTAKPVTVEDLEAFLNPACNPWVAYTLAKEKVSARVAADRAYQMEMLQWGRGFLPVTDNAQDPGLEKVLTPASVVQESYQQLLGSSVRQLESANDIGQMIGALYAGVTTQIISDNKGLAGISRSSSGQPSYLEQIARESSQGVVGAAVNAALKVLNSTREVESTYLGTMNSIAANLTQTINQLRSAEMKCWDLMVPKAKAFAARPVCRDTSNGDGTSSQQCDPGYVLDDKKIAISTSSRAFSQPVIDSQITPLAGVAVQNVQSAQKALSLIDQLIAGVTNTTSLNAQRLALQQLDSLVAQKALHTQYDTVRASQQYQDVVTAMTNLLTDSVKAWGDSTDTNIGWCNVNNEAMVKIWAERWMKIPRQNAS
jgi:hypothetical protein